MIKYRSDLYKLLPDDSVIAELGTAEGYFAADMLRWEVTKKLYVVDNWATIHDQSGDGNNPQEWHDKNYQDAMARLAFGNGRVEVLRGISWNMAKEVPDESLDLLYVDCCHTYKCVMNDLHAWVPKVKPGGIVAGHDFLNKAYGVYQAVVDFGKGFTVIPENKNEDAGFYFIK